jgi:tetratricopeptide (TPR) repeat protein
VAAEALTHRLEPCPDAETLGAYLDGRLAQDERARVTAHVADCDDCYFVVTEAAQIPSTAAELEPELITVRRKWWESKAVVWSSSFAGALATAAMLWLAVGGDWLKSRADTAAMRKSLALQAALVAAVGNERLVEPRLTGGFAYGPLRGTVRSGQSFVARVSPDVRIAAAQIEKEDLANRTALTLRALAAAKIALGDVEAAVTALEAGADRPTPDPRTLSDLAAAYIIRATRMNQPQDFTKAVTAADRAVKADPKLAEAWFNRAYALERLSLPEARDAWADYLKVDDRSGWADEARQHLQRMR